MSTAGHDGLLEVWSLQIALLCRSDRVSCFVPKVWLFRFEVQGCAAAEGWREGTAVLTVLCGQRRVNPGHSSPRQSLSCWLCVHPQSLLLISGNISHASVFYSYHLLPVNASPEKVELWTCNHEPVEWQTFQLINEVFCWMCMFFMMSSDRLRLLFCEMCHYNIFKQWMCHCHSKSCLKKTKTFLF